jgi:hypothetical protein
LNLKCKYEGKFNIIQFSENDEGIKVQVLAELLLVDEEPYHIDYGLQFVIEEFQKQSK